jgi:hypothetical protein
MYTWKPIFSLLQSATISYAEPTIPVANQCIDGKQVDDTLCLVLCLILCLATVHRIPWSYFFFIFSTCSFWSYGHLDKNAPDTTSPKGGTLFRIARDEQAMRTC